MKTLQFTSALLFFVFVQTHAQVSVNVNIGVPPPWAPAGYDRVGYYYLPDVQAYYDVHASHFIYLHDHRWIRAKKLPHRHRHYDLYSGYKVVLTDYHGRAPYDHFRDHRIKYARGYAGPPQRTYGERPSKVVYVQEAHPHKHHHKKHGRGHKYHDD